MLLTVTIREPWCGQEAVEQEAGQGEMTEVVGCERQLEAVGRSLIRRPHHGRVIDQQVEPGERGPYLVGGPADRVQRGEIESGEANLPGVGAGAGEDLVGGAACLLVVTAGEHDRGSARREQRRGLQPDARAGPGHYGDAPLELRDRSGSPASAGRA
jgi:hypothetical protein